MKGGLILGESRSVVVEVTRMPIYKIALGSVPTQYFLLYLNN